MPYQNISAVLSEDQRREILDLIQNINNRLNFLINLTPDERQALPKMGDKTQAFVAKAIELAKMNPVLVPPYVNINEMEKDYNLALSLKEIVTQVQSLSEKLSDTYLAAGSEAYVTALAFYNSAKAAAKMNVSGTDAIVNELSERFEKTIGRQSQPQPLEQ